ncbi:hypothetical protein Tco_0880214 [Tanacetum coccineum]
MCRRVLKTSSTTTRKPEPWNSTKSSALWNSTKSSALWKKVKVTADLLANIDSVIEDKNLVMYAINGLGDRYEHVASIIRQSKTLLTLLETRSMLLLEESRMNRKQHCNGSRDTTSSPISVQQFTCDNLCSIEIDPLRFCVKDLRTRHLFL